MYARTVQAILCAALLSFARVAVADGSNPVPNPSASKAAAPVKSADKAQKASWPISDAPVHRLVEKGIPNFGKLNDVIWRSGQPTRDGYKALAAKGLKTVVNLRDEFRQDEELIPEGVHYFCIPVKDEHAPTAEQASEFLKIASDPMNWPLLVHCESGQGRAGVMSALVRSSLDRWDHGAIMKEVGNFRVRYLGLFKTSMAKSQQKFIQHWEESAGVNARQ